MLSGSIEPPVPGSRGLCTASLKTALYHNGLRALICTLIYMAEHGYVAGLPLG